MKRIYTAYLAGSLMFIAQTVQANPIESVASADATPDSLQMFSIDETVIVGEKVNSHNLSPMSVSAMPVGQLRSLEVNNISNLSGVMPNLFIADYGSRQTRPISIRGVMSKVKNTAVGYYVDGMPHFEVSSFDMDMIDVKSIEVFRGPQSTLYGRNTLGGLISVRLFSPFEYQGTRVRLGYGNYNTQNVQISHYAKLNGQFALNASGYYQHQDGYFKNEYLNKKADKLDAAGGKIAFHWRPSDKWNIRLNSHLDYLDQGGYPYAKYDPEADTLAAVSYNRECGYKRLISNSGLMVQYRGESFSMISQTSFEHIDDDQSLDQDFSTADNYFVTNGINTNIISEELTFKSEGDGRLQWVAGASGFSQHYSQRQGTDYLTSATNYLSLASYKTPVQNAALFGQVSYNVVAGLSATVGARLDYEHSSQDYRRVKIAHADGSQTTLDDFHASMHGTEFIPKFGLLYQFNEQNTVFANVSRGYKAGGFNAVFETEEEKTYKPEYNWNYEAGVKVANADNSIAADVTLFYIDWKDQHINRTVAGKGNVICNAGHSDSKGLEMNLMARPIDALYLQCSYGYTYARFLDYKKSEKVDYSGNMTPLVPRSTLSALASYTICPQSGLDRLTFTANVTSIGKHYWLEDNAVCQSAYTLLGAKVALAKGPFTLELWGKNLTGTHYLSYYFVSSAKYAQDGVPTTFGATFDVKF